MVATAFIALAFLINIAIAWKAAPGSQIAMLVMVVSLAGLAIAIWQNQTAGSGFRGQMQDLTNAMRQAVNKIEAGELQEVTADLSTDDDAEVNNAKRTFGDLVRTVKTLANDHTHSHDTLKRELSSSQKAVQTATTHLMFAD